MEEINDSKAQGRDAIGLVGIALAVMGMWEMPLLARLTCFLGSAICLSIAFIRQTRWPVLVRWLLSIAAVGVLALMSLTAIERG